MKFIAVFALALALSQAVQIKSSADLALESKVNDLKESGWGRVAVNLIQLQLATGGPMNELVTAFQNLIRDLNFKLGSE